MTRVLLAAPVRNRAWILPAYLEAVSCLRVPPGVECDAFFLVNGCTDRSGEILAAFRDAVAGRMRVDLAAPADAPPAGDSREAGDRLRIYRYLANLRNALIDRALAGGYDYLFSVDSDILLPPDALERLLGARLDAVAAVIHNDELWSFPDAHRQTNMLTRASEPGGDGATLYDHRAGLPAAEPFEVDVTGACILIARAVLEAGCRYADHVMGEDVPFCEQVRARGFRLHGHGGVRPLHAMSHCAFLPDGVLRDLRPQHCHMYRTALGSRERIDVSFSPLAAKAVLGRVLGAAFLEEARRLGAPAGAVLQACTWDRETDVVSLVLTEDRAAEPG